jgi:hypothetical protein
MLCRDEELWVEMQSVLTSILTRCHACTELFGSISIPFQVSIAARHEPSQS